MIDKVIYSEKEVVIFNGVIDLIKNGKNLYNIKVSDIAKASYIGKGTIYDYFNSKEEAISKALMYYMDNEIEKSYNRIIGKDSFKDKYYEILFIIKDSYKSNMFIVNNILFSEGFKTFYKHLVDEGCSTTYFLQSINDIMIHLLDTGEIDGIVTIKEEKYYYLMSIRASISTFSHFIDKRDYYKNIDIEKAMDVSYEILLKTLK